MGIHCVTLRSVMSKIILVALLAILILDDTVGLDMATHCSNYQDQLTYSDEYYKAKYEFKLTISKGNFDNARQQCASFGGDLITVNLGPKGKQYSKRINELVHSRKVWIGLSDRGTEGQWRFPINNKIFNTQNANNVFHWHAGEPNNGGNGLMDDVNCDDKLYGLCEIKIVDCDKPGFYLE